MPGRGAGCRGGALADALLPTNLLAGSQGSQAIHARPSQSASRASFRAPGWVASFRALFVRALADDFRRQPLSLVAWGILTIHRQARSTPAFKGVLTRPWLGSVLSCPFRSGAGRRLSQATALARRLGDPHDSPPGPIHASFQGVLTHPWLGSVLSCPFRSGAGGRPFAD